MKLELLLGLVAICSAQQAAPNRQSNCDIHKRLRGRGKEFEGPSALTESITQQLEELTENINIADHERELRPLGHYRGGHSHGGFHHSGYFPHGRYHHHGHNHRHRYYGRPHRGHRHRRLNEEELSDCSSTEFTSSDKPEEQIPPMFLLDDLAPRNEELVSEETSRVTNDLASIPSVVEPIVTPVDPIVTDIVPPVPHRVAPVTDRVAPLADIAPSIADRVAPVPDSEQPRVQTLPAITDDFSADMKNPFAKPPIPNVFDESVLPASVENNDDNKSTELPIPSPMNKSTKKINPNTDPNFVYEPSTRVGLGVDTPAEIERELQLLSIGTGPRGTSVDIGRFGYYPPYPHYHNYYDYDYYGHGHHHDRHHHGHHHGHHHRH